LRRFFFCFQQQHKATSFFYNNSSTALRAEKAEAIAWPRFVALPLSTI
jgi:hypothetical protein